MSDQLIVRPAARQSARLLIGLFGESGSGKTKSALLLARGIAGPNGKIIMGDTESGRGEFFADEIPGGYDVIPMDAPFSPARGVEMLGTMERTGAVVGIVDSVSHFWEGQGGVLDLASDNEDAGKKGLAVWRKPKLEHAKFVLKLMQSKMTLIVCMRAKFKSRQVKGAIIKDDHLSALQADDFLFELTLHMQVNPDHSIIVTKKGRADLRACLPPDNSGPLEISHGEAIAAWAKGGTVEAPKGGAIVPLHAPGEIGPTVPKAIDPCTDLKKKLWAMTKGEHKGNVNDFWNFLFRVKAIDEQEAREATLTEQRLIEAIEFVEGLA